MARWVDDADRETTLPTLSEFVRTLVVQESRSVPGVGAMAVERLDLDLPVEFDVTALAGTVARVGVGPPTQWVETTVMPVFHRMRLTVEASET
jgi:hypothetical protein